MCKGQVVRIMCQDPVSGGDVHGPKNVPDASPQQSNAGAQPSAAKPVAAKRGVRAKFAQRVGRLTLPGAGDASRSEQPTGSEPRAKQSDETATPAGQAQGAASEQSNHAEAQASVRARQLRALPPGRKQDASKVQATASEPAGQQVPADAQAASSKQQPMAAASQPARTQAQVARQPAQPHVAEASEAQAVVDAGPEQPHSQGIGKRIRRVSGLDGLRGFAVLAVVIYHFAGSLLPGGYLGVDVFFVLSGFLITSLLVREHAATGRISLKQFWIRRLRRIAPAATMVLLVVTPIARVLGGNLAVGLERQFFSSLFFVNNWVQILFGNSYFAQDQVQIFAHYWSLAVEEQFYILFPPLTVLVFLLWKKAGEGTAVPQGLGAPQGPGASQGPETPRPGVPQGAGLPRGRRLAPKTVLAAVLLPLLVLSAVLMAAGYTPGQDPTRVYYGTDTHAFGLLIGAVLALLATSDAANAQDSWPRPRFLPGGLLGLLGVLAGMGLVALLFVLPDSLPAAYRGGIVGANVLTALVVLAVIHERGPAHWLLQRRPLRWLGERSFSLYLWHWPVIQLLRHWFPQLPWWILALMAVAVSLPLSAWSYRWIETPVRRGGYLALIRRTCSRLVNAPRLPLAPLATVLAVTLVLPSAALASVWTAPEKSDIETFLDEAAAQQQAPPQTAAPISTEPPKPLRVLPRGDEITAVGDSIMLASADGLRQTFPGIYVDGQVSRALISSIPILQAMQAQGTLDQFVVLGFGTNSQVDDALMDQVMGVLGPDRVVVITEPYGDRPWIPYSRQAIVQAARKYPNLYIAPWCHKASANPALLRDDLIHPTVDGAFVYSAAIKEALLQWKNDAKQIPATCP